MSKSKAHELLGISPPEENRYKLSLETISSFNPSLPSASDSSERLKEADTQSSRPITPNSVPSDEEHGRIMGLGLPNRHRGAIPMSRYSQLGQHPERSMSTPLGNPNPLSSERTSSLPRRGTFRYKEDTGQTDTASSTSSRDEKFRSNLTWTSDVPRDKATSDTAGFTSKTLPPFTRSEETLSPPAFARFKDARASYSSSNVNLVEDDSFASSLHKSGRRFARRHHEESVYSDEDHAARHNTLGEQYHNVEDGQRCCLVGCVCRIGSSMRSNKRRALLPFPAYSQILGLECMLNERLAKASGESFATSRRWKSKTRHSCRDRVIIVTTNARQTQGPLPPKLANLTGSAYVGTNDFSFDDVAPDEAFVALHCCREDTSQMNALEEERLLLTSTSIVAVAETANTKQANGNLWVLKVSGMGNSTRLPRSRGEEIEQQFWYLCFDSVARLVYWQKSLRALIHALQAVEEIFRLGTKPPKDQLASLPVLSQDSTVTTVPSIHDALESPVQKRIDFGNGANSIEDTWRMGETSYRSERRTRFAPTDSVIGAETDDAPHSGLKPMVPPKSLSRRSMSSSASSSPRMKSSFSFNYQDDLATRRSGPNRPRSATGHSTAGRRRPSFAYNRTSTPPPPLPAPSSKLPSPPKSSPPLQVITANSSSSMTSDTASDYSATKLEGSPQARRYPSSRVSASTGSIDDQGMLSKDATVHFPAPPGSSDADTIISLDAFEDGKVAPVPNHRHRSFDAARTSAHSFSASSEGSSSVLTPLTSTGWADCSPQQSVKQDLSAQLEPQSPIYSSFLEPSSPFDSEEEEDDDNVEHGHALGTRRRSLDPELSQSIVKARANKVRGSRTFSDPCSSDSATPAYLISAHESAENSNGSASAPTSLVQRQKTPGGKASSN